MHVQLNKILICVNILFYDRLNHHRFVRKKTFRPFYHMHLKENCQIPTAHPLLYSEHIYSCVCFVLVYCCSTTVTSIKCCLRYQRAPLKFCMAKNNHNYIYSKNIWLHASMRISVKDIQKSSGGHLLRFQSRECICILVQVKVLQ